MHVNTSFFDLANRSMYTNAATASTIPAWSASLRFETGTNPGLKTGASEHPVLCKQGGLLRLMEPGSAHPGHLTLANRDLHPAPLTVCSFLYFWVFWAESGRILELFKLYIAKRSGYLQVARCNIVCSL